MSKSKQRLGDIFIKISVALAQQEHALFFAILLLRLVRNVYLQLPEFSPEVSTLFGYEIRFCHKRLISNYHLQLYEEIMQFHKSEKCTFQIHSNRTLRLELFAPPTSL